MIRLRHFLHPIKSVISFSRSISRLVWARAYRRIAQRKMRSIRISRGRLDRCWCGGWLAPIKWHAGYGVCAECGCYINWSPPLQKELSRIYSFDLYWHTRQQLKEQPTIEHRYEHDRSDGRVDYWIGLIRRFGPGAGRVVEVGCAHGVLLAELKSRGYQCIGVEPDERTADWVRRNIGLDVRHGFFPEVSLPTCDLFLAFDVIEHCVDPVKFVKGAAELLNPGGVAIIQTPVERYNYQPPFGERFEAAFDDVEHLCLFTNKAMQQLAARAGLQVLDMTERLWLHHEVCVFRKPW